MLHGFPWERKSAYVWKNKTPKYRQTVTDCTSIYASCMQIQTLQLLHLHECKASLGPLQPDTTARLLQQILTFVSTVPRGSTCPCYRPQLLYEQIL